MTSVVVWCLITVTIECFGPGQNPVCINETAAKGTLVREVGDSYQVDFSEYAKSKNYVGDYTETVVSKDACTPEKK